MNDFIFDKKVDFEKALEFFQKETSSLRTGRANPALLDNIEVEAYGVNNKMQAVANVSVLDAKTLTVTPWDKTIIKNLEKAVTEANLGLGIQNEGDKLRLIVPQMTEDNRLELVKKLNEKHEQARITVRQVREDVKEMIEKAEEANEITEDDKFRYIKDLDEEVGNYNNQLKETCDNKEQEIMTV